MNKKADSNSHFRGAIPWEAAVGLTLVVSGGITLLGRLSGSNQVMLSGAAGGGLVLLVSGFLSGHKGYLIAGWIVVGAGAGLFLGLSDWLDGHVTLLARIGIALLALAGGFAGITLSALAVFRVFVWWPLIPAMALASVAGAMISTPGRLIDFVLYCGVAAGLTFAFTGIYARLIGLIIPGALLLGAAPGVYFAWSRPVTNPIAQTGVMLVCMAVGWVLISVLSRGIGVRDIWWPLIPGGILAVIGWGLTIAGNPGSTLKILGNAGSIALVILGAYLFLIRQGIHRQ